MFKDRTVSKRQTLMERIECIMAAIAFAESNEHDTALEMLAERPDKRLRKRPQSRKESRKDRRPVLMA
jgi:hypothetical protein